jgi:signal peptidase II
MQFAGNYGKLILSLFRIFAVGFLIWYIIRLSKSKIGFGIIFCFSLILAGALGNIIDSAFYGLLFSESTYFDLAQFLPAGGGYATFLHGRVVDMLYFPVLQGTYPDWFPFVAGKEFIFFRPVFNISDSAITTGVLLLLIFQRKFFYTHDSHDHHSAVNEEVTQISDEKSDDNSKAVPEEAKAES